MALLASVLPASAALAIPPPLDRPDWYDCTVARQDPAGTVSVTRSIPPEGVGSARVTLWRPSTEAEGMTVWASWEGPAPVAIMSGRIGVLLFTPPTRVEVRRIGPDGDRTTRFTGAFPAPDRIGGAGLDWGAFLAMARGATALEIAAVDADRHTLRSVRIPARDLERVGEMVTAIQPEFDAVVADYRNRCVLRGARPAR
jgi:hypothetical protein